MKRYLLITLLLVAALLFGCAAPAPAATPTPATPAVQTPAAQTPAPAATPAATPTAAPAKPALKVIALKGPTGMGMVQLMQAAEKGETAVDYAFTLAGAPDEITGKVATGEVDIAAAPINLASALYNKTNGGVSLIAINTLGVLYVLENGDTVKTIKDLAGKTLYATGQGATPEYIIRYLLEKNGILDKVKFEYMAEHAELATLLVAGEVKLAMLPEPNVTSARLKNDKLRVALDLTKEWDAVSGGTKLVQGCLIVRNDVLKSNPEAVKTFLEEYARSAAFALESVDEAAALIEKYSIMPSAAAAKAALPSCNIVCLTGAEMKASAQAMLETLFAADPKSVGGKLPEDAFYYIP